MRCAIFCSVDSRLPCNCICIRCYNLHDALEAAHALSNGQKYQFSAVLSHEVQVNSPQYESQSSSVNDKLSLRCTYCMDNKTVLLCAFCGCNVSISVHLQRSVVLTVPCYSNRRVLRRSMPSLCACVMTVACDGTPGAALSS